jgi:hypothetical protein
MGIDPEAFKALQKRVATSANRPSSILGEVVKAKGKTKPRVRGQNKTEAEYSRHLEAEKQAGRISAYWYEAWKIRIADNCTWTPDFVVIDCDGMIEWHDTKSWWEKAKKVGIEEDALIKMKAVAEMYPQFKVLATWKRGGVWEQRVF